MTLLCRNQLATQTVSSHTARSGHHLQWLLEAIPNIRGRGWVRGGGHRQGENFTQTRTLAPLHSDSRDRKVCCPTPYYD